MPERITRKQLKGALSIWWETYSLILVLAHASIELQLYRFL